MREEERWERFKWKGGRGLVRGLGLWKVQGPTGSEIHQPPATQVSWIAPSSKGGESQGKPGKQRELTGCRGKTSHVAFGYGNNDDAPEFTIDCSPFLLFLVAAGQATLLPPRRKAGRPAFPDGPVSSQLERHPAGGDQELKSVCDSFPNRLRLLVIAAWPVPLSSRRSPVYLHI